MAVDALAAPATTARLARVDVLGVGVSAINMRVALDEIERWIVEREKHYVCVTGVHGVMESVRDHELRQIHNLSGLTTPDGMPLVWAGRLAGAHWMRRVCGRDLLPAVCEMAAAKGWRSYFYGGGTGVADRLASRLLAKYPGMSIVGAYSPPFRELTPDEDHQIVEQINATAPDLVWVGLSTPKQERWMAAHVGKLNAPVLLGVGAAFDMHAGTLRHAPRWMQQAGLEWLYRLYREPRRLWRRYASIVPGFLIRIASRPPRLYMPQVDPSDQAREPAAGRSDG